MALTLFSPNFENHQVLPSEYLGDEENHSPELRWSAAPIGTVELALVCEDLDSFRGDPRVHWLVYRIAPELGLLSPSIPRVEELGNRMGILQGLNDFGEVGYTGPLPHVGDGFHRYLFTLFALDQELWLPKRSSYSDFTQRVSERAHVVETATLLGLSKRESSWCIA